MNYAEYNDQQSSKTLRDLLIEGSKIIDTYGNGAGENKQAYMDKHFGGVSFDAVLELVKQHYPEKFI